MAHGEGEAILTGGSPESLGDSWGFHWATERRPFKYGFIQSRGWKEQCVLNIAGTILDTFTYMKFLHPWAKEAREHHDLHLQVRKWSVKKVNWLEAQSAELIPGLLELPSTPIH